MRGYRGYLELMRPANVATALADVLAGYAVAGLGNHSALGWLLVSTACLYAGGVVLNDVFDRNIDWTERPERPIPSGRVSVRAASGLGGGLLAFGVFAGSEASAAAGVVAAATAASVLLYDAWGKRQGLLGPVNMGMCRGLNLLLGIAASPPRLAEAWPLALLPLVYIAAVTAVSRGEVHGGRRGIGAFALISLSGVLVALLALAVQHAGGDRVYGSAGVAGVAGVLACLPDAGAGADSTRDPDRCPVARAARRGDWRYVWRRTL